jgi:poly(3-hydroxybutyrate) depolymerase
LDPVPLKQAVDFWVDANGCTKPPHQFTSPVLNKTRFSGCENKTEVISFFVKGMGHAWSPSQPSSFSTNDALWRVFRRHHL